MKEFEELTTVETERMVVAGIELLAAITDIYGPEEGERVWNAMADTVGTGFKHAVFMAMLTGKQSCVVTLVGDTTLRNRAQAVPIIKTIRSYTGFGLKEAKDIWDQLANGITQTVKIIKMPDRRNFIHDLQSHGVRAL